MGTTQKWQTDYLFSASRASWLVHLGVILMTWWGVQNLSEAPVLSVWMLVMMAATTGLFVLGVLYRRQKQPSQRSVSVYAWAHSLTVGIIGISWGGGALLLMNLPEEALLLYTFALGGTALGAVSSQHSILRSCLVSIWTSVPLLAFSCSISPHFSRSAPILVMILLYVLILTVIAVRLNRFVRNNNDLTEKLNEKIGELKETNQLLDKARERAVQGDQSKSALLAQASHELRQPVHAIAMLTESLHSCVDSDQGRYIIARIESSVRSLSRMFRSLLDLSALDAGAVTPRIEVFALDTVFEEAVRQTELLARSRKVDVRTVCRRRYVETDPALLLTMVQNLVTNAIKYGGNAVLVGCRIRSDRLRIEIHDNGQGLTQEEIGQIFDEYVRIDPHGVKRSEGVGLGLSITNRMAGLLGLRIGVRSTPGRGSIFYIEDIPRAETPAQPLPAAEQVAALSCQMQDKRILLIDDDAAAREALAELLSSWGCQVDSCAVPPKPLNPQAGQLLLTDHDLGSDVSGFNIACDWQNSGGQVLAIITGVLSEKLERDCKEQGITLLVKPAMPAQIRSLLLAVSSGAEG